MNYKKHNNNINHKFKKEKNIIKEKRLYQYDQPNEYNVKFKKFNLFNNYSIDNY